jgi:hypothetical protein
VTKGTDQKFHCSLNDYRKGSAQGEINLLRERFSGGDLCGNSPEIGEIDSVQVKYNKQLDTMAVVWFSCEPLSEAEISLLTGKILG